MADDGKDEWLTDGQAIAIVIIGLVAMTFGGMALVPTDDTPTEPSNQDNQQQQQSQPEELTDEQIQTVMEAYISTEGIEVEDATEQNGVVYFEYTTQETTQMGIASEMGTVAGAYAGAVDQGWDVNRMEVTVLGPAGDEIGTYRVQTEWANQYQSGQITRDEFSRRVLQTLEANQ
jgi:hypothetical protein